MQLNPAYGHDKLVIASLILGVISLPASLLNLLTLPIPVIGIVLGLVGFKRNKGMAIAGIVLSSIGLVLSIVIFAVGVHIYQNRDTTINRLPDSSNSEDTTSTKGSTLSAPCYSFTLPEPLKAADIAENTDCVTTIVNTNSTEDIGVNSSAPATAVTEADTDTYLKAVAAQAKSLVVGKDGSVTAEGFTILDGSRAYKVLGTQNTGHYKYFGYIIALAPREYTSSAGDKLQAFIIASDSATSPNRLDEVVQSWQWQ
jgi:hypothetical protein